MRAFLRNSNAFVFDTEVIFEAVEFEMPVVEVPISTRYFSDMSSVGFHAGRPRARHSGRRRFLAHRAGLVSNEKFRR